MTWRRWKGMRKKNISITWTRTRKGILLTTLEFKIFDQNKVLFLISTTIWQEKCWAYRLPMLLDHLPILCYFPSLSRYLSCSELTFIYCPISKVHFASAFLHSILKLAFIPLPNFSFFTVMNSPSVEFIVVPLSFILKFVVRKIELSSSTNSIIIPLAIVVASIFKLISSLPMLHSSFLLPNILVSICVLFCDLLDVFRLSL